MKKAGFWFLGLFIFSVSAQQLPGIDMTEDEVLRDLNRDIMRNLQNPNLTTDGTNQVQATQAPVNTDFPQSDSLEALDFAAEARPVEPSAADTDSPQNEVQARAEEVVEAPVRAEEVVEAPVRAEEVVEAVEAPVPAVEAAQPTDPLNVAFPVAEIDPVTVTETATDNAQPGEATDSGEEEDTILLNPARFVLQSIENPTSIQNLALMEAAGSIDAFSQPLTPDIASGLAWDIKQAYDQGELLTFLIQRGLIEDRTVYTTALLAEQAEQMHEQAEQMHEQAEQMERLFSEPAATIGELVSQTLYPTLDENVTDGGEKVGDESGGFESSTETATRPTPVIGMWSAVAGMVTQEDSDLWGEMAFKHSLVNSLDSFSYVNDAVGLSAIDRPAARKVNIVLSAVGTAYLARKIFKVSWWSVNKIVPTIPREQRATYLSIYAENMRAVSDQRSNVNGAETKLGQVQNQIQTVRRDLHTALEVPPPHTTEVAPVAASQSERRASVSSTSATESNTGGRARPRRGIFARRGDSPPAAAAEPVAEASPAAAPAAESSRTPAEIFRSRVAEAVEKADADFETAQRQLNTAEQGLKETKQRVGSVNHQDVKRAEARVEEFQTKFEQAKVTRRFARAHYDKVSAELLIEQNQRAIASLQAETNAAIAEKSQIQTDLELNQTEKLGSLEKASALKEQLRISETLETELKESQARQQSIVNNSETELRKAQDSVRIQEESLKSQPVAQAEASAVPEAGKTAASETIGEAASGEAPKQSTGRNRFELVAQSEQDVQIAREQVSQAESTLQKHQATLSELEGRLNTAQQSSTELTAQIEEHARTQAQLDQSRVNYDTKFTQLTDKIEQLAGKKTEFEGALKAASTQHEQAIETINLTKSSTQHVSALTESTKLMELEAQQKTVRRNLSEYRNALEDAKARLADHLKLQPRIGYYWRKFFNGITKTGLVLAAGIGGVWLLTDVGLVLTMSEDDMEALRDQYVRDINGLAHALSVSSPVAN